MMRVRWRSWMAPFFTIWVGQAFSIVGSSLVQFALVWWLTASTGSATILATASVAGMLPGIALGPFAGACVDRWNRRMVMILADSLVALVSAGLALLAWSGDLAIWHVYLAMALRSLGGAFHWPAMQASTTLMVPKEQLTRVAGMNQTMHGVLNIVSPPLGALLVAALPLHGIMAVDVGTAALAIVPLFFIAIPQPTRAVTTAEGAARPRSLLADTRAGLAYVWHWPAIMGVIAMAMLINMVFNPVFSLLPLLITRHMGGEAIHLGAVNSAFGLGVVAGGLLLSVWGGFRKAVYTSMLGIIGMGVGVLVTGISPDGALGAVIAGMLLAGAMNPLANGPLFALLQRTVEPEMQGRVFTVLSSGCGAISPIGLLLAGPITDAVGLRPWYVVAGIVTIAMGFAGLRFRPFLRMEEEAPPSAAPLPTLQAATQDATLAGE